ncbi:family 16 glycoside hydrolase [Dyadobacter psychrophilus]|uniref:PA14 domain-containing protein n=1 Tax=Dyadobacter psychrophilus TaxID=651661 RepID=A0A1T5FP57_9BACT|nr:family 16 glycoside hydrolase [Dyadobacter psychrophilus]SKB97938.1 PA14 domain-containing protein [Dyadobacter psychrophilus]
MFKINRSFFQLFAGGIAALAMQSAYAQQPIPLNDLSAFTTKSDNWKIVGNAAADISKENVLITSPGKGVLACTHEKGKYGNQYELISNFKHGDLDIELDFMLTKGSNSGIYLQGNYEVQLFDSWGKKSAKYNDNGGIYERWNDSKPEGEKGYEGYAPRFNVAKAPGLWQNIKISYQAPRFDANGKKTSNAVFLSIVLNGVTIHENVEVSGPTRGSLTGEDVAMGPIRIQGDHGSLAIKNIIINNFDKKPGTLSELSYKTYYGALSETEDLSKLTAAETGKAEALSWEILKENNNYSYVYTGRYNAATEGDYNFKLQASGNSYLKIDGKNVIEPAWKSNSEFREGKVNLKAGDHTIEIFNNKKDGWMRPVLGLWVSGPGFREVAYHTKSSAMAGGVNDPILISAGTNTITRSFMDFKKGGKGKGQRVVHAVSVGSPTNLHYTYDLDKGTVLQVWRGEFLDATPMWHDRGDGSSKPRGSVTLLGDDMLLGKSAKGKWQADTTGSGYHPKGYVLDDQDVPTFQYQAFGSNVTDYISVVNNQYFERIVKVNNAAKDLVARLADGANIEKVADGLYAVDNKSYYIQLADKSVKPEIRTADGMQELLVPVTNGEVKYSILF